MEPMRILLLIVLLGAASCQNDTDVILRRYETTMVGCYFPADFQGEFVTQVNGNGAGGMANEPIQYSYINITFDAIPVWGLCYMRIGINVLLIDSSDCIRCFRILQRSRNVIEVYSGNFSRCYLYMSSALASCDTLNTTSILYRTKQNDGTRVKNVNCPIIGMYHFKYNLGNIFETSLECGKFTSEISNCPNGSVLRFNFEQCHSAMDDIAYNCFGSWPGPNGSKYFALWDNSNNTTRPRYRCGLLYVDKKIGKTYMALSSDSSCTQDLYNSTIGYETFILTKRPSKKSVPDYVKTHVAAYPKWSQGVWEESIIVNGTMTFNDVNGYNSYTFITVESNEETGHYTVYSRDQCEQSVFVCLMMMQRSENVLEFTMGQNPSLDYRSNSCDDINLGKLTWMTQARIERVVESPCPITGKYTGTITDVNGMCAELSSNCHTREIMYFKVSDCATGQLYEERTYLCLGQWEEKGVMYTYTMRNETHTNECFVGLIVDDEEIYIKEAGDHCTRNIDPQKEGMRLYKKGQCYGNSPSPAPIPIRPIHHNPTTRITTPRSRLSGGTKVTGNTVSSSTPCRTRTCTNVALLIVVLVAFFKAASSYTLE